MGKKHQYISVSKEDMFSAKEINYELLYKWLIMDVDSMNKIYMPVTKIKALIKIIENNYDKRENIRNK